MGTLGVLQEAGSLGLLDLRVAVKRLQETSFYLAPEVLARLLKDQP
jgi:predicted nucleic acid-binding protein